MVRKWVIGKPDEAAVKELSAKGGLTVPAARALVCAGYDTLEKAAAFFGEDGETEGLSLDARFSDPFLIRDMERACELLSDAVDCGDLICVYGDYDCDGITSTALLSGYLTEIGGNVITYINERSEGYGMNCAAVRKLHSEGVKLIVTVDNGISAIEEAKLCRELGITLVITDHHQAGEILPDAEAVVDPHRSDCPSPFKELCGCGVALKLVAAMEGGDMGCAMEQYSDLAAIATVGDVVPLRGENREIVRHGLHFLENTENEGLRALIEKSGMKAPYTSLSAAFMLVPRINAAGRIGSPLDALNVLMSEDGEEAEEYAEKLCSLNARRRGFEGDIMQDISEQIAADPSLLDRRALIFRGRDWHHGVVGIAAARCAEKYGKPVFLMSADEGETELRGSARSIEGLNVFKALTHASDTMTKFGGHSLAGGFSLDESRFEDFSEKIEEYAAMQAAMGISCRPFVEVCGVISPEELDVKSVSGLSVLEPFGEGNQRPVFLLQGCTVGEITSVSNGAHTKLTLLSGQNRLTGMMFGTRPEEFPLRKGDEANVIVSPEINTYNGRQSVTLRITDIRKKGINQAQVIAAEDIYEAFRRGEEIDSRLIPRIIPERADLEAVYKATVGCALPAFGLYSRLEGDMNFCKFLICLDIFSESGLMEHDRGADRVKIIKGAPKANTDLAPSMARLREMLEKTEKGGSLC